MMIRPDDCGAIQRGEIDLCLPPLGPAPGQRIGTRMRTGVGLIEVTSVERVTLASAAGRAGAARGCAVPHRPQEGGWPTGRSDPVFQVGLRLRRRRPARRPARAGVPDARGDDRPFQGWLDRLDASSTHGPWTRTTLAIIDRSPGGPGTGARGRAGPGDVGVEGRRPQAQGARPRRVAGDRLPPLPARRGGTGPCRGLGSGAAHLGSRARRSRAAWVHRRPRHWGRLGVTTVEQVRAWSAARADCAALHGVGPVAITRLRETLAESGLAYADE